MWIVCACGYGCGVASLAITWWFRMGSVCCRRPRLSSFLCTLLFMLLLEGVVHNGQVANFLRVFMCSCLLIIELCPCDTISSVVEWAVVHCDDALHGGSQCYWSSRMPWFRPPQEIPGGCTVLGSMLWSIERAELVQCWDAVCRTKSREWLFVNGESVRINRL